MGPGAASGGLGLERGQHKETTQSEISFVEVMGGWAMIPEFQKSVFQNFDLFFFPRSIPIFCGFFIKRPLTLTFFFLMLGPAGLEKRKDQICCFGCTREMDTLKSAKLHIFFCSLFSRKKKFRSSF